LKVADLQGKKVNGVICSLWEFLEGGHDVRHAQFCVVALNRQIGCICVSLCGNLLTGCAGAPLRGLVDVAGRRVGGASLALEVIVLTHQIVPFSLVGHWRMAENNFVCDRV
jgi:hypothetical protein